GEESPGNSPEHWRKFPHMVLIGPSGQMAILPPPSGIGTSIQTRNLPVGGASRFMAYPMIGCHKPVAWKGNKLVTFWRGALQNTASAQSWVWHPFVQSFSHKNGDGVNFDTNADYDNDVILDGHHSEYFYPRVSTDTMGG